MNNVIEIDDPDFSANFDGVKWTVKWKWSLGEPELSNQVSSYGVSADMKQAFEDEVQSWIDEGILIPVPENERVTSVIPLMAIRQVNKQKVRPVLDFKQLNKYVSCHTGASAVCGDTIRRWRKIGDNLVRLDLRKAYLQLHINPSLRKHQAVRFKGKYYFLTRLGFGLNCSLRIMNRILQEVLALNDRVRLATDNYLDDIVVNEDVASADLVKRHLQNFGLEVKPFEDFNEGSKVLGLAVKRSASGELRWSRGNPVSSIVVQEGSLSRRELFSVCGQLVSHYPVAGWLRVACSFIKRVSEGSSWEDDVGENSRAMLAEVLEKLRQSDPVGGKWKVSSTKGKVWCDASSLATGCALEVDGEIVEDGSWLRKEDTTHINLAELDSVLKGLNLAAMWNLDEVEIVTDSATVFGWLQSALYDTHMVRTRGLSEILVKRRLSLVRDVCKECGIRASVSWIQSCKNKADVLTRVSKKWLQKCAVLPNLKKMLSGTSIESITWALTERCIYRE